MNKFFGRVGFVCLKETAPSVWTEVVTERHYCGDITRNSRRYQDSSHLNDNLNISNTISIVADPYALQNFHSLRYVNFMCSDWEVTDIEVQYPRLVLTLGGVYNGNKVGTGCPAQSNT